MKANFQSCTWIAPNVLWVLVYLGAFFYLDASVADILSCDEGTKSIKEWMINDDYCDCLDGSDEQLTSACSHKGIKFTCLNVGSEAKVIPSSRVMDGICDCCDGKDEDEGICPNFCKEEGDLLRNEAITHYYNLSLAWEERENLVAGWRKLKSSQDLEVATMEKELKQIRSLIKTLQVLQLSEEKKERNEQIAIAKGETVEESERADYQIIAQRLKEGKSSPSSKKEKDKRKVRFEQSNLPHMNEVMETKVSYHIEVDTEGDGNHTTFQRQVNLREYMTYITDPQVQALRKEHKFSVDEVRKRTLLGSIVNNGPEGWMLGLRIVLNICGLPLLPIRASFWLLGAISHMFGKALQSFADYIEYVFGDERMADFMYKFRKDGLVAIQPRLDYRRYSSLRTMVTQWKAMFEPFKWYWTALWNAPIEIFHYFVPKMDKSHIRAEAELVRKSIRNAKDEITNIKQKLDDILRERDGMEEIDYGAEKIFLALEGQCFKEQNGEFEYEFCPFKSVKQDNLLIGKWGKWGKDEEGPTGEKRKMYYEKGLKCYGGQIRHTDVNLQCGRTTKIVSVEEPEMCFYSMIFTTPLACDRSMLFAAEQRLESLGMSPREIRKRMSKKEDIPKASTKHDTTALLHDSTKNDQKFKTIKEEL